MNNFALFLANGLSLEGGLIMITSIFMVTSLMTFCVYKVLTSSKK